MRKFDKDSRCNILRKEREKEKECEDERGLGSYGESFENRCNY